MTQVNLDYLISPLIYSQTAENPSFKLHSKKEKETSVSYDRLSQDINPIREKWRAVSTATIHQIKVWFQTNVLQLLTEKAREKL